MIVITGIAGVGKTFATSIALRSLSVDTFWYSPPPEGTFDQFILEVDAFVQCRTTAPITRAREVLEAFHKRRAILVVDDLSDGDPDTWAPLIQEASATPGTCAVIVVTRAAITFEKDRTRVSVPVRGLRVDQAPVVLALRQETLPLAVVQQTFGVTNGLALADVLFGVLCSDGHDPLELFRDPLVGAERVHKWMDRLLATLDDECRAVASLFALLDRSFTSNGVSRLTADIGVSHPQRSSRAVGESLSGGLAK